ncbi:MAG TPA: monofunctional biosynthetic peptidoglycan transglycosylase [Steroidobacteraceae bacterium]|jgi:monofunctional biosynthetic peptidoglycan transglycosylase|nr:monofunctional biosynthetic peptidoglycan transglycosylase [Steroidobacteraceae bacterium]
MKRSLPARIARWVAGLVVWSAAVSVALVLAFRWLPVPVTAFMLEERIALIGAKPALEQRHDWVPWPQISRNAALAVVAAEDQKFFVHRGFDFDQIGKAVSDAQRGRRLRGASTITQQVAKNLFLWGGQNWFRKAIEAWFTVWIELLWPKERILEVYLNSAQFGRGVWGVEAASRTYFGKGAALLSRAEAAALAAVLPSPNYYRVVNPGPYVRRRQAWILGQMRQLEGTPGFRRGDP